MNLSEAEKEALKEQLLSFVKRVTANPTMSTIIEKSNPAELAVLPAICNILLSN